MRSAAAVADAVLPEAGANQSRCQVEGSTPQMASEMMEGEVESGVSHLGFANRHRSVARIGLPFSRYLSPSSSEGGAEG